MSPLQGQSIGSVFDASKSSSSLLISTASSPTQHKCDAALSATAAAEMEKPSQNPRPVSSSIVSESPSISRVLYLYMKTIERAHMPNKMWERVKLPRNYAMALKIIDKHLAYWPKLLVHKTKQRLTKLTQIRIRSRKLALKTREKIMTVPTKEKKREARREEKAFKATQLENVIQKELLERLRVGLYPGKNPVDVFEKNEELIMETENEEEEKEYEREYVEGDYEEEDDMEDFALSRTRDDVDDDDNDELDDDDDDEEGEEPTVFIHSKRVRNGSARRVEKDERPFKSKKKVKKHVEVEREVATERKTSVH